jgi:hypothetical protein
MLAKSETIRTGNARRQGSESHGSRPFFMPQSHFSTLPCGRLAYNDRTVFNSCRTSVAPDAGRETRGT